MEKRLSESNPANTKERGLAMTPRDSFILKECFGDDNGKD